MKLSRMTSILLILMSRGWAADAVLADGLVGHWKLRGDAFDHSGNGNHASNHGVTLEAGSFDGIRAHLEVSPSDSLRFGTGDFSFSVWIHMEAAFDGSEWSYAGVPVEPEATLQTHCLAIFQGDLIAGMWPLAKVARYQGGEKWDEVGRAGEDGTEVNSLVVYNGKLYGGSIPRAEVCRFDGQPQWTSLRRFYSPDGWNPEPPADNGGRPTREQVAEWSRVTSMTIHRGRLFAAIGNCTSSAQDSPADIRGSVHSIEAGKCVSYDDELAPGWRHLAAVRDGGRLRLSVDGVCVAESSAFTSADYDLSTDRPLRIGAGQTDYFNGRMADLRAYRRVLGAEEIRELAGSRPE